MGDTATEIREIEARARKLAAACGVVWDDEIAYPGGREHFEPHVLSMRRAIKARLMRMAREMGDA